MNRLIILVALIITTTSAQADWYRDNTTTLDLELNKMNLVSVMGIAKTQARKCHRFLRLADVNQDLDQAQWRAECVGNHIVGNTMTQWTKQANWMPVFMQARQDIEFKLDFDTFIKETKSISNILHLMTVMKNTSN